MSLFFNKHVRYFLKVVSTGSFNEAARMLNLSQPALSIALKNFEADVGCELFLRDKKNAALTPKGRKLYEKLLALDQVVTAETKVVLEGDFALKLRIGSIPWFAKHNLLPLLKKPEHQKTMDRGQFFIRPGGILRQAVERGKLDFAFTNWPAKPPLVLSHPLQNDPAVIGGLKSKFAHISKAKSYKDLENEKWIYHESRGIDWTKGIEWDKSGFLVTDVYAMRFLILEGYGIYEFQLAYFSKQEQQQLAFAEFPTRFANNRIYAIWRRDISADAKQVLDQLISQLSRL